MNERVIDDPTLIGWVQDGTTSDGDPIYKWASSGGGSGGDVSGAGMVISETEPTDKVEGMQWLNPTNGLVLFWDDAKWLQMPGSQDGADGADGVWEEDANGASYTGNVTVTGDLLASKPDAGTQSLAIGVNAGATGQKELATAVGRYCGETNQGIGAFAAGSFSGNLNQGNYSVGIGYKGGSENQGESAVAIGQSAAEIDQGNNATAVGRQAGMNNQGSGTVSMGIQAGMESQGQDAVAIGGGAGKTSQGLHAISGGTYAGNVS